MTVKERSTIYLGFYLFQICSKLNSYQTVSDLTHYQVLDKLLLFLWKHCFRNMSFLFSFSFIRRLSKCFPLLSGSCPSNSQLKSVSHMYFVPLKTHLVSASQGMIQKPKHRCLIPFKCLRITCLASSCSFSRALVSHRSCVVFLRLMRMM